MNKKQLITLLSGLALLASLGHAQSASALLNRGQEKNMWCWAACSEMILDWDGSATNQTAIADWAIGGVNQGNYLDTGFSGIGPFVIGENVYFRKGVKQVLNQFGEIDSEKLDRALTLAQAQSELDNDRPFIARQDWSGGGAHVHVIRAYAGSNFSVEDPWPIDSNPAPGKAGASAVVGYTTLVGTGPNYWNAVYTGGSGNTWTRTLVLGNKSLDVVFLIDSTGSMGSYINNVKSQASSLLDTLADSFRDFRVSVVEYRDFPQDPYGEPTDFITKVRTSFTDSKTTAVNAINAITVNGGNDFPEAVFSALKRTAAGDEIGGWRTDSEVTRIIILIGDAPPQSPEGWAGGTTYSQTIAALLDEDKPISVQALHVGGDSTAASEFSQIASATGGISASNVSDFEVAGVIEEILDEVSRGRFPSGAIKDSTPVFTFSLSTGKGLADAGEIDEVQLELEVNEDGWRSYGKYDVPNPESGEFEIGRALPPGEYRWRLAGKISGTTSFLPDGTEVPVAETGNFVEEEYTEFTREFSPPGPITKLSPQGIRPFRFRYTLNFEDDPLAEAYAVRLVYGFGWDRTILLRERSQRESDGVVSATIWTLPFAQFNWFVQGLNEDRMSPDSAAWD